ncbi:MAG TPA: hypothetical protein VLF91_06005 [Candidatus Saccharimonadales bacterium]|nr:hypothetical protein [Candidatus Saccharimonadales bacterium]
MSETDLRDYRDNDVHEIPEPLSDVESGTPVGDSSLRRQTGAVAMAGDRQGHPEQLEEPTDKPAAAADRAVARPSSTISAQEALGGSAAALGRTTRDLDDDTLNEILAAEARQGGQADSERTQTTSGDVTAAADAPPAAGAGGGGRRPPTDRPTPGDVPPDGGDNSEHNEELGGNPLDLRPGEVARLDYDSEEGWQDGPHPDDAVAASGVGTAYVRAGSAMVAKTTDRHPGDEIDEFEASSPGCRVVTLVNQSGAGRGQSLVSGMVHIGAEDAGSPGVIDELIGQVLEAVPALARPDTVTHVFGDRLSGEIVISDEETLAERTQGAVFNEEVARALRARGLDPTIVDEGVGKEVTLDTGTGQVSAIDNSGELIYQHRPDFNAVESADAPAESQPEQPEAAERPNPAPGDLYRFDPDTNTWTDMAERPRDAEYEPLRPGEAAIARTEFGEIGRVMGAGTGRIGGAELISIRSGDLVAMVNLPYDGGHIERARERLQAVLPYFPDGGEAVVAGDSHHTSPLGRQVMAWNNQVRELLEASGMNVTQLTTGQGKVMVVSSAGIEFVSDGQARPLLYRDSLTIEGQHYASRDIVLANGTVIRQASATAPRTVENLTGQMTNPYAESRLDYVPDEGLAIAVAPPGSSSENYAFAAVTATDSFTVVARDASVTCVVNGGSIEDLPGKLDEIKQYIDTLMSHATVVTRPEHAEQIRTMLALRGVSAHVDVVELPEDASGASTFVVPGGNVEVILHEQRNPQRPQRVYIDRFYTDARMAPPEPVPALVRAAAAIMGSLSQEPAPPVLTGAATAPAARRSPAAGTHPEPSGTATQPASGAPEESAGPVQEQAEVEEVVMEPRFAPGQILSTIHAVDDEIRSLTNGEKGLADLLRTQQSKTVAQAFLANQTKTGVATTLGLDPTNAGLMSGVSRSGRNILMQAQRAVQQMGFGPLTSIQPAATQRSGPYPTRESPVPETLRNRLVAFREAAQLSREQVAQRLRGVGVRMAASTVWNLETGLGFGKPETLLNVLGVYAPPAGSPRQERQAYDAAVAEFIADYTAAREQARLARSERTSQTVQRVLRQTGGHATQGEPSPGAE